MNSDYGERHPAEHRGRAVVLPPSEIAFRSLCGALQSDDAELRLAAAQELRDYGTPATLPLCGALVDVDETVRVVAAESLGVLGDSRAVGPLTAALRQSLVGGSGRKQLVGGALLALGLLLLVGGYFWGAFIGRMGGGLMVLGCASSQWIQRLQRQRRARSQFCRAISEALVQIAEQHPTPELREVLPELKALAVDRFYQDRHAQRASLKAVQRIETLTHELKNLPISSSASTTNRAALPLASSDPNESDSVS